MLMFSTFGLNVLMEIPVIKRSPYKYGEYCAFDMTIKSSVHRILKNKCTLSFSVCLLAKAPRFAQLRNSELTPQCSFLFPPLHFFGVSLGLLFPLTHFTLIISLCLVSSLGFTLLVAFLAICDRSSIWAFRI